MLVIISKISVVAEEAGDTTAGGHNFSLAPITDRRHTTALCYRSDLAGCRPLKRAAAKTKNKGDAFRRLPHPAHDTSKLLSCVYRIFTDYSLLQLILIEVPATPSSQRRAKSKGNTLPSRKSGAEVTSHRSGKHHLRSSRCLKQEARR